MSNVVTYRHAIKVLDLSTELRHRIDDVIRTFNPKDRFVTKSGAKILGGKADITMEDVERVKKALEDKEKLHSNENREAKKSNLGAVYSARIKRAKKLYELYIQRIELRMVYKTEAYYLYLPSFQAYEPNREKRRKIVRRLVNGEKSIPVKYIKRYEEVINFLKNKITTSDERKYIAEQSRLERIRKRDEQKAKEVRRLEERSGVHSSYGG